MFSVAQAIVEVYNQQVVGHAAWKKRRNEATPFTPRRFKEAGVSEYLGTRNEDLITVKAWLCPGYKTCQGIHFIKPGLRWLRAYIVRKTKFCRPSQKGVQLYRITVALLARIIQATHTLLEANPIRIRVSVFLSAISFTLASCLQKALEVEKGFLRLQVSPRSWKEDDSSVSAIKIPAFDLHHTAIQAAAAVKNLIAYKTTSARFIKQKIEEYSGNDPAEPLLEYLESQGFHSPLSKSPRTQYEALRDHPNAMGTRLAEEANAFYGDILPVRTEAPIFAKDLGCPKQDEESHQCGGIPVVCSLHSLVFGATELLYRMQMRAFPPGKNADDILLFDTECCQTEVAKLSKLTNWHYLFKSLAKDSTGGEDTHPLAVAPECFHELRPEIVRWFEDSSRSTMKFGDRTLFCSDHVLSRIEKLSTLELKLASIKLKPVDSE